MADFALSQLPSLYGGMLGLAQSGGMNWISLGITLMLSTIIGGLLLVVILAVAGREWHEGIHPARAFFVVLFINIINVLASLGIFNLFALAGGTLGLILPFIIWIVLLKLFFMEMAIKHVLILSVVSYVATLFIVPMIVGMLSGMIRI